MMVMLGVHGGALEIVEAPTPIIEEIDGDHGLDESAMPGDGSAAAVAIDDPASLDALHPMPTEPLMLAVIPTPSTAEPAPTPLPTPTPTPVPTSTPEKTQPPKTYKGITEGDRIYGEITYYCVCRVCCGSTEGVTASGKRIKNGMKNPRIVSCNWLPLGTKVRINSRTYTVADRGGSGLDKIGRIDIFMPEGHEAALSMGRQRDVRIRVVSFP